MARESNGWGSCIKCGETLTPEDAERLGWSDRCEFCLVRLDLWKMVDRRIRYAQKHLEKVSTEEWKAEYGETGQAHWTKILKTYQAMAEYSRRILDLKREVWGETYPEEY